MAALRRTYLLLAIGLLQLATVYSNTHTQDLLRGIEGSLYFDLGNESGLPGRYYLSNPQTNTFDAEFACTKISPTSFLADFNTDGEMEYIFSRIKPYMTIQERIIISGFDSADQDECQAIVKRKHGEVRVTRSSCTKLVSRFLCEVNDINLPMT